jgi:YbbR domain-containing protein
MTNADPVGFDPSNSVATSTFPQTMTSNPVPVILLPKITAITPATASAGTTHTLTIDGQRLYRTQDDANTYVLIANKTIPASQFVSKSDVQIRVTVPDLPPGEYPVHVRFNAFVSQDEITFKVT